MTTGCTTSSQCEDVVDEYSVLCPGRISGADKQHADVGHGACSA